MSADMKPSSRANIEGPSGGRRLVPSIGKALGRGEAAPVVHLADEMLDHFLRYLEIRDDAVAHRPDRLDVARRPAQHHLGVVADRTNLLLAPSIDRGDDRRLVQDDAATLYVNQGIRGSQINRHIARQCAEKTAEHA